MLLWQLAVLAPELAPAECGVQCNYPAGDYKYANRDTAV